MEDSSFEAPINAYLPHRTSNRRLLCRSCPSLLSPGNMLSAPGYFLHYQIRLDHMDHINWASGNICSRTGLLRESQQTGQMRIDAIDLEECEKAWPTPGYNIVPVRRSLINRISWIPSTCRRFCNSLMICKPQERPRWPILCLARVQMVYVWKNT